MAAFVFKAEQTDDALATSSGDNSRPSQSGTSPDAAPVFRFGQEWNEALDGVESRSKASPPRFVVGETSGSAVVTAAGIQALSDSGDGVQGQSAPLNVFDNRQSPTPLPAFLFNFDPPPSTGDTLVAQTATSGHASLSGPSTPYRFGNFRGLHNVTPVGSPRQVPDQQTFHFSLPPSPGLSPSSALKAKSSRKSLPETSSDVLRNPFSPQIAAQSVETPSSGQSVLIPRNRSQSDLSISATTGAQTATAYDVLNEETPHHVFFSNSFQTSIQRGIEIAKAAKELTKSIASPQNQELLALVNEAENLSSFQGTNTRTIAILGDSGQGKSSLINSLLHFPCLAKTGDTGSACTSVVTEYRQKQRNQKENIVLEVEILSSSQIEAVVTDYLWRYRLFHNGDTSDMSGEEFRNCENDARQAWSVFKTAFKHHKELTEHFLQDGSSGAQEKILDKLVKWTREIKWPGNVENGVWRSSATTAQECFEKTKTFRGDQYWPFTKTIRVYINAQILKTGIVLADLPGLQDTNLARVKATQDYLMRSNTVFIVANISRAVTDQSLQSSLFSVLSRHVPLEFEHEGAKALRVAVEIDLDNAKQEFCGPNNLVRSDVCDKIENDIEAARQVGNSPEKKHLKLRRKVLFIEARNEHVKRGLQKEYESKVPNRTLDVFCVSNKMYSDHIRNGNLEFIMASGIPELRKFCHTITADAQMQEANHFLTSSIPSLLTSLEIRIGGLCTGDEERATTQLMKNKIHAKLNETSTEVTHAIQQLTAELRDDYHSQIQNLFTFGDKWQKEAASRGLKWQNTQVWHWCRETAQYDAWCRNYGNHSTYKKEREDWNAQIIWKMRSELEFAWNIVEAEIPACFGSLQSSFLKVFEDLQTVFLSLVSQRPRSLVLDALVAQINNVRYRVDQAKENFATEVNLTRRYASETNLTSFIRDQMQDAYRNATDQRGTGKSMRQKSIVQGRITDGMLFPAICGLISDRMYCAIQKTEQELSDMMMAVIGHIRADVDSTLGGRNADEQQATLVTDSARLVKLRGVLSEIGQYKSDMRRVGQTVG
ncbi:hypothetical protein QQS21_006288 [Conoideocrella luteorostrata]|uniref:GED domain-containing protein n=1 Tax=Conoideocrella luteorostrata TaxID=1105319 RepID=A0AAJ0CMU0_9HYPO|nr:hypothetical protein QQS21_006288 [Conoideocrella luteorostrata]